MAAVEVEWPGGVTEPPYRLLTDVDGATTTGDVRNGCGDWANVTEDCDTDDPGCGCRAADNDGGAEARSSPNWPVFLLFLIVITAIGGNVLVCLAVAYKRKLQNMFNYFLVSLALSDMLSAIVVMPLSIIKMAVGTSNSCFLSISINQLPTFFSGYGSALRDTSLSG